MYTGHRVHVYRLQGTGIQVTGYVYTGHRVHVYRLQGAGRQVTGYRYTGHRVPVFRSQCTGYRLHFILIITFWLNISNKDQYTIPALKVNHLAYNVDSMLSKKTKNKTVLVCLPNKIEGENVVTHSL